MLAILDDMASNTVAERNFLYTKVTYLPCNQPYVICYDYMLHTAGLPRWRLTSRAKFCLQKYNKNHNFVNLWLRVLICRSSLDSLIYIYCYEPDQLCSIAMDKTTNITSKQHGFRRGMSCETQLIEATYD